MDKKKDGYVAGIGSSFGFVILLVLAINNAWNTTDQLLYAFAMVFLVLGIGCFWKPETIGTAVSKYFSNLNETKRPSESPNSQVQKKSSGIQVMAHDQSNVSIQVHSNEGKNEEKDKNDSGKGEREILRKETIIIPSMGGYHYEFEDFKKGDHLKGEITSSQCINIYFVDSLNFDKWDEAKDFDSENCHENILEASVDYVVPRKGKWYIIIQNDGAKSSKVKLQFYVDSKNGD